MAFDFSGKKILVTGAGRGIGRCLALALVKAGCKVYALDLVPEFLETLTAQSDQIVPVLQDLSNWSETKSTLEKLEPLDGLVNNAGTFTDPAPALETTKEVIEKNFNVNVMGYIHCIQVIAKKMIAAGKKGSIVNMSSLSALIACPGFLSYAVSKAAIDMVTKQFALELGPHGIRVNSINPTIVETEMTRELLAAGIGEIAIERTPMRKYLQPEDLVGTVLYLLSDYASMVTGTTYPIDGGISCNITTKQ